MKRILVVGLVALPFLVAVVCLVATLHPAFAWDTSLPRPNGYDKFIEAAGALKGDAGNYEAMSEPELSALIATNAEALALVHSAFTCECRVPIRDTKIYAANEEIYWDGCQNLVKLLAAKGRLAELENHSAEAAKDYLDIERFAIESGRGGLLIDGMMGIKMEGFAQVPLEKMLRQLDAKTCRAAASTLESFDAKRQDYQDVYDRERIFHHDKTTVVLSVRFITDMIKSFAKSRKQNAEMRKTVEEAFYEKQFESRVLAIKFAARAYELEKGESALNIHDLVPAYLKSVPHDPGTTREMVYPFR